MDRCSGSHDEVEPFNDSSADVDFKVVSPYKLWPKECRDECVYLDLQGTNHTAQGVHAAPRRASRREDQYRKVARRKHQKDLLQRLADVRRRLTLCADQVVAAHWGLRMHMAFDSADGPRLKDSTPRPTQHHRTT